MAEAERQKGASGIPVNADWRYAGYRVDPDTGRRIPDRPAETKSTRRAGTTSKSAPTRPGRREAKRSI